MAYEKKKPAPDPKQQRIDNFKWLHKRARNRHQERRAVEWKVSISVWTALLASVGVIVLKVVYLPWWSVVCAIAFGVVVIRVTVLFENWIERMQLSESRLSYWYSSAIEDAVGATPPQYMQPGHDHETPAPWHRFDKEIVDAKVDDVAGPITPPSTTDVDIKAFKIYITKLLVVLFIASVVVQADWPRFMSHPALLVASSLIIGFALGVAWCRWLRKK